MKKQMMVLFLFVALILAPSLPANATTIDLNDFFADPTVTVTPDGSLAILAEDPGFSTVLLANDPGLGDPEVIFAGSGLILTFNYVFDEPAGNNDEFGAFVLSSVGVSAGTEYEFFTQDPGSGTVSFDLSGLVGEPFIGMQFQLSSLFSDGAFTSTATVSNVNVVPEPATMILVGTGLVGLLGVSRKKFRKIS